MSTPPIPVTADRAPFATYTTPLIEQANRLMSLRAHPGFLDVLRIIDDMVDAATKSTSQYPGWDAQVIVVLKVRQQIAMEFKPALLSKINELIDGGVAEARAQVEAAHIPVKSAADAVDQGDLVRQKVLESFSEMDTRAAGSYDPNPEESAPGAYDWH